MKEQTNWILVQIYNACYNCNFILCQYLYDKCIDDKYLPSTIRIIKGIYKFTILLFNKVVFFLARHYVFGYHNVNLQICHHEIFMESNETNKLYQIINQYTTYVFSCHIGFSYNVRYSNTTSYLTSRHNHIKATETRNVEVNKKDVQKDITCCILICLGILYLQWNVIHLQCSLKCWKYIH